MGNTNNTSYGNELISDERKPAFSYSYEKTIVQELTDVKQWSHGCMVKIGPYSFIIESNNPVKLYDHLQQYMNEAVKIVYVDEYVSKFSFFYINYGYYSSKRILDITLSEPYIFDAKILGVDFSKNGTIITTDSHIPRIKTIQAALKFFRLA
jgi:hypothetical protein